MGPIYIYIYIYMYTCAHTYIHILRCSPLYCLSVVVIATYTILYSKSLSQLLRPSYLFNDWTGWSKSSAVLRTVTVQSSALNP